MGVSRSERLYQTTARRHGLYCNEGSSRVMADVRDERDQLNEAILALERMPFHVLSVQFLTNGGVTPICPSIQSTAVGSADRAPGLSSAEARGRRGAREINLNS